jgi:hypothetical protein
MPGRSSSTVVLVVVVSISTKTKLGRNDNEEAGRGRADEEPALCPPHPAASSYFMGIFPLRSLVAAALLLSYIIQLFAI